MQRKRQKEINITNKRVHALLPGDIILTRSSGFMSKLIRRFTHRLWQKPASYSHSEIVVEPGIFDPDWEVDGAMVISADKTGVNLRKITDIKGRQGVIYRIKLSDNKIKNRYMLGMVAAAAKTKLGSPYPVWRLVMHLLDWMLFDAYLFRRVGRTERVMECSSLVAWSFDDFMDFGLPWYLVSPDSIYDHLKRMEGRGDAEMVIEF